MIKLIDTLIYKLSTLFYFTLPIKGIDLYDETIKKHLNVSIIPNSHGNYHLLASQKEFQIHPDDLEVFQKLFYLTPPKKNKDEGGNKTIGNGELSIYWLFKYQKKSSSIETSQNSDLTINSINVEIKSYPSINRKIDYGRFGSDKKSLKILNFIFGIHSVFSEIDLNSIEDKEINSTNFNGHDLLNIMNKLYDPKSFTDLHPQLNINLSKILNYLDNPSTPLEATKKILLQLLTNKLTFKPGNYNFILNVNENGLINCFYVDFDKFKSLSDKTILNSIEIKQSNINLKLKTLFHDQIN
jgi:hypothetical protein